jgi:hypothetical protein
VSPDRLVGRVSTTINVNQQPHRLYLEAYESDQVFAVFMYGPVNTPPARMAEMARIINRINMRTRIGSLGCHDDEDANPVQFRASIDVEGSALTPRQIGNLVGAAMSMFKRYDRLLAATALTGRSVDSLWNEFLEEDAARRSEESDAPPTEL